MIRKFKLISGIEEKVTNTLCGGEDWAVLGDASERDDVQEVVFRMGLEKVIQIGEQVGIWERKGRELFECSSEQKDWDLFLEKALQ